MSAYSEWSECEFDTVGDGFFLSKNRLVFRLAGLEWRKSKWDYSPSSDNWQWVVDRARLAAANQRLPFYVSAHDYRRSSPFRWKLDNPYPKANDGGTP